MNTDQSNAEDSFVAKIAEMIRESVKNPMGGGVSRLINEPCFFTFRWGGEDGFILTDEMRAGVEALLGEKLVEHTFAGLELELFLVPSSAAKKLAGEEKSQLAAFVEANGPVLSLKGRTLTVQGLSGKGHLCAGTFKAARASYLGVLCVNSHVLGHPGAEVWSVLSGRREVARFAVSRGALVELGR